MAPNCQVRRPVGTLEGKKERTVTVKTELLIGDVCS